MINLKKYNRKSFNKNPIIDKKVKSLFLLFDKTVDDFKLNVKQSILLIDKWINVFVSSEEYEIAESFKKRKFLKWKKNGIMLGINRLIQREILLKSKH